MKRRLRGSITGLKYQEGSYEEGGNALFSVDTGHRTRNHGDFGWIYEELSNSEGG